ncbi:MAG: tetrahydrofolate synthase [Spirochaetaceae bacterium]|jgi:dihydrofolate synthase/folylpolyglutamate synthase|nr:tetrahydrofolate synthase [Spirochaetaceae bacterium]
MNGEPSFAPFVSSGEVFNWLGRFVNLEQGVMPPSMRPERMRVIANAALNPEQSAPAIHVAGSKGKGSITAMVSAILQEAGFKVGRYMSPHVEEYRERITLGDSYFDESVYARAGNRLREIEHKLSNPDSFFYKELLKASLGEAPEPTFFELLTLYFFLCAKDAGCNAFAVETGMGGRLDPTNISRTECAVITGIELEHTDMLGDTIEKIAVEKAGIIKSGKPVLILEQGNEEGALEVFKKTAEEKNAPFYYLPDFVSIENINVSKSGASWSMTFKNGVFPRLLRKTMDLNVKIPGAVYAQNAAAAVCAVLTAFPQVTPEEIKTGLLKVRPPARFEKLCDEPEVVVDGAHTAVSVKLCAETWASLYGEGGVLIFGCAAGKDARAMALSLLPLFSLVVITKPGDYKISFPEKNFDVFKQCAQETGCRAEKIVFIKDTKHAVNFAMEYAQKENLPVLGTGSFYMAAEIRGFMRKAGKFQC